MIEAQRHYAAEIATSMPEFELIRHEERGARDYCDGVTALEFLEVDADLVDLAIVDLRFDVNSERLVPFHGASSASLEQARHVQGLAIVKRIRDLSAELPIALIARIDDLGFAATDLVALAASRFNIVDPGNSAHLRREMHALLQTLPLLRTSNRIAWGFSVDWRALERALATRVKDTLPLLIEGESGTGKTWLAEQVIHSHRAHSGVCVRVNCAYGTSPSNSASPSKVFVTAAQLSCGKPFNSIVEVVRAAYRGTLIVEELHHLPEDEQRMLLHAIETVAYSGPDGKTAASSDVNIVIASPWPLAELAAAKRIRHDLFANLAVAPPLRLLSLRNYTNDIPFLMQRIVETLSDDPRVIPLKQILAHHWGIPLQSRFVLGFPGDARSEDPRAKSFRFLISDELYRTMLDHSWPGNFRELSSVMCRMIVTKLIHAVEWAQLGRSYFDVSWKLNAHDIDFAHAAAAIHKMDFSRDAEQPSTLDSRFLVELTPSATLNAVSNTIERQYLTSLFEQTDGDFAQMATQLLGSATKARAVRLRFNQLGLKVSALRQQQRAKHPR